MMTVGTRLRGLIGSGTGMIDGPSPDDEARGVRRGRNGVGGERVDEDIGQSGLRSRQKHTQRMTESSGWELT
jgi:hypothetical protein